MTIRALMLCAAMSTACVDLEDGEAIGDEVASAALASSCGPDLGSWGTDANHLRCTVAGRTYYVYLPVGYTPSRAYPVIVSLHGGGSNAAYQESKARFHTPYVAGRVTNFADQRGVIVVEPEGNSLSEARADSRTWNAGNCCIPSAIVRNVDDVGFLRAVVADLARNASIDRKRVFVTGHSNGGEMAHRLACQAGDVFAAAVSVSAGRANYDSGTGVTFYTCPSGRKAAILEIHGDADGCYPWEGGPGKLAVTTTHRGVVDSMDFGGDWGTLHRCSPVTEVVSSVSDGQTRTTCWRYRDCAGADPVQLCRVYGGGHVWPGGTASYGAIEQAMCGGVKPQTIGNHAIWAFMAGHPMP